MTDRRSITFLVLIIAAASTVATSFGVFSIDGPENYQYETVHGEKVIVCVKGLYRADVSIQEMAQDYIILCLGITLFLILPSIARNKSLRGFSMLAGTLGYLLVTHLFYLTMGMYNQMFLVYAFCWEPHSLLLSLQF